MTMNRRELLTTAMAAVPLLRGLPQAISVPAQKLTDSISVYDAGGTNVVAHSSASGVTLVDTGVARAGDALVAAVQKGAKITTVFNTHYHLDHTGNNERFSLSGAKIIAHDRTRQWMSNDTWLPDQDRYEKARPKAAWPTESFFDEGSMKAEGEQIDYGYLIMAHTSGDIYVHFKNANVIAVGDVASPLNDPELDWMTGAWIGGRVDAMDTLLKLTNDQTKIVPGTGPVMTRAEFKAERDLMEQVRMRLFNDVREGDGPQDMLEKGILKGLARTWKDPYKFLYAAAKGLWAHHDKIDANVV
jgi:cyclase